MSDEKGRNWATIVYPESAPIGWIKTLEMLNIRAFISPLHDKDIDKNGNLIKPHHHVETMYDGTVDKKRARQDFGFIGGVGCERVRNKSVYARYLCHLDNPDKCQYSPDDVICLGGSDYNRVINCQGDSKQQMITEMQQYILENNILSLVQFYRACWAEDKKDWLKILERKQANFYRFIKSSYWELREGGEFQ